MKLDLMQFNVKLANLHCVLQKFAEKPKGEELEAMKVDTSVLGKHCFALPIHPLVDSCKP